MTHHIFLIVAAYLGVGLLFGEVSRYFDKKTSFSHWLSIVLIWPIIVLATLHYKRTKEEKK